MVATKLTRWPVTLAALDLLRENEALAGVLISEGFPGMAAKPEMVWVGEIQGDITYPHASGVGRSHRDEEFRVPFVIKVAGNKTPAVCRLRLEEILAEIESEFADLTLTVFEAIPGLLTLEVAEPISDVQDTPQGALGFAAIALVGKSRLS